MKKIIMTIFIAGILFCIESNKANAATFYYINENNIGMTKSQYNNLISLGFSEQEITTMNQEEFNLNKDLSGHIVESVTKYYKTTYVYHYKDTYAKNFITKENIESNIENNNITLSQVINEEITEEEFNNFQSNIITTLDVNPAIHETNAKKLTTTISHISSSHQYRVKNDLIWKTMPSNRSYDLFAIAINNSEGAPLSGSHYARTNYTLNSSCSKTNSSHSVQHTSKWKFSSFGYAVAFQLPKNTIDMVKWDLGKPYPCYWNGPGEPIRPGNDWIEDKKTVTALSSTMYYNVVKGNNTSSFSAYGSYQHSITTVSINPTVELELTPGGGFGGVFKINTTLAQKFDGMGGTHAQILNPVW